MDIPEYKIWKDKFDTFRHNKREACQITFEQYVSLGIDAGISPTQIGTSISSYCMGRVGDVGQYSLGNCRFITVRQNLDERRINGGDARISATKKSRVYTKIPRSEESRAKTSVSLTLNNANRGIHPWKHPRTISNEMALSIWARSDVLYDYYNSNKCGYCKLAQHINCEPSTTFQNILKKFKLGWNPSLDEDWVNFKKGHDESIHR